MSQFFLNLTGREISRSESTVVTEVDVQVSDPSVPVVLIEEYDDDFNGILHIVPEDSAEYYSGNIIELPEEVAGESVYWIATDCLGFIHNYSTQFMYMTIDGGYLVALVKGAFYVSDPEGTMHFLNYSYGGDYADYYTFLSRDKEVAFVSEVDALRLMQYRRNFFDEGTAESKILSSHQMDNGYFAHLAKEYDEMILQQEVLRQEARINEMVFARVANLFG